MVIGKIFVKIIINIIFYNIVKKDECKKVNTLILNRLININRTPTPLNKETCKPAFNFKTKFRRKGLILEQNTKIREGNILFKKLIKRQTSQFNLNKQKDEYKRAQNYKKNICSFPSIDFRKTYQNYFDKENEKFKSNFKNFHKIKQHIYFIFNL